MKKIVKMPALPSRQEFKTYENIKTTKEMLNNVEEKLFKDLAKPVFVLSYVS